jgi:hypothetical protein
LKVCLPDLCDYVTVEEMDRRRIQSALREIFKTDFHY